MAFASDPRRRRANRRGFRLLCPHHAPPRVGPRTPRPAAVLRGRHPDWLSRLPGRGAVPGAAGVGRRAGGQRPAAVSRAGDAHRPLARRRCVRADRPAAAGAAGVAAGRRAGQRRRAGGFGAAGRGVGDAARADGGAVGMGADARALPGARAAVGNRRLAGRSDWARWRPADRGDCWEAWRSCCSTWRWRCSRCSSSCATRRRSSACCAAFCPFTISSATGRQAGRGSRVCQRHRGTRRGGRAGLPGRPGLLDRRRARPGRLGHGDGVHVAGADGRRRRSSGRRWRCGSC